MPTCFVVAPRAVVTGSIPLALLLSWGTVLAQTERLEHPIIGDLPPAPAEMYVAEPPGLVVTPYVAGLEIIWSLEFAPDGRLFVAERPGRIRVVSPDGRLDATPWATLANVETRFEDGLMGLTLHPDFEHHPWVYVMYTMRKGEQRVNRVSRLRELDGRGMAEEVLVDDLPSARIHNGGRIRFGSDGMLYLALGDVADPMVAQDLRNPAGSILRVTPDGAVPADNPWPGNPIWAYGLRNVNGLAFRPSDGALFAADHGPSTEWLPRIGGFDEINIIVRGANYGWPLVVGAPGHEEFEDPLLAWDPAAPPGDLAFYDAALMPELHGDLFFSTLRSETLFRIRFQDPADPERVTAIERWFHTGEQGGSSHGRLRGIAIGPDGALYVGTGNRDRRSPLRDGDDQVLRIAPPN